jgi:hypothetical protein
MADLFALDTFATRLVAHTLVTLWFKTRFGGPWRLSSRP